LEEARARNVDATGEELLSKAELVIDRIELVDLAIGVCQVFKPNMKSLHHT
jgi:hypothetical protein